MIYITDDAQKYLKKLLINQKKDTQIRLFIQHPGTSYSKIGISYYFPDHNDSNDIIIKFNYFSVYIDRSIQSFIKDTKIDIISNTLGTQLSLKSPNLYKENNSYNIKEAIKNIVSLEDRVKYIFEYQINPQLSIHGGGVSLIHITKDLLAVIKFYGGCNGCAMSFYTIKEGIETILKRFIPELKGIIDITAHQKGAHSYYQ